MSKHLPCGDTVARHKLKGCSLPLYENTYRESTGQSYDDNADETERLLESQCNEDKERSK